MGQLFYVILDWFENLIYSARNVSEFLTSDLEFGGISINPLLLLTFGGLTAYLIIAIIKWVAN